MRGTQSWSPYMKRIGIPVRAGNLSQRGSGEYTGGKAGKINWYALISELLGAIWTSRLYLIKAFFSCSDPKMFSQFTRDAYSELLI